MCVVCLIVSSNYPRHGKIIENFLKIYSCFDIIVCSDCSSFLPQWKVCMQGQHLSYNHVHAGIFLTHLINEAHVFRNSLKRSLYFFVMNGSKISSVWELWNGFQLRTKNLFSHLAKEMTNRKQTRISQCKKNGKRYHIRQRWKSQSTELVTKVRKAPDKQWYPMHCQKSKLFACSESLGCGMYGWGRCGCSAIMLKCIMQWKV